WIATIESPLVKRESFIVSDIKVRIFQETAVATCLWSTRFILKGQYLSTQFRAIHVYVNTPNGWHVVSGQTTNLPPDVQQVLYDSGACVALTPPDADVTLAVHFSNS